jgi:predicted NAD-dependent protein-ADP-ribosyltransferase YbiA (DUF1768 family)
MHGHDTENQIFFYEHEFYVLSNFSSFQLEWKGEVWMTSEHAYHSEKFEDPEILDQLRHTRSAHDAMKLAYANRDKYRSNWDEIKLKDERHFTGKSSTASLCKKEIIRNWR